MPLAIPPCMCVFIPLLPKLAPHWCSTGCCRVSPSCLCACICLPPSLACTSHDLHPPPLFGAATVRPCRWWASFLCSSLSRFFVHWCKGQWCSGGDLLREGSEGKRETSHVMPHVVLPAPSPTFSFCVLASCAPHSIASFYSLRVCLCASIFRPPSLPSFPFRSGPCSSISACFLLRLCMLHAVALSLGTPDAPLPSLVCRFSRGSREAGKESDAVKDRLTRYGRGKTAIQTRSVSLSTTALKATAKGQSC